MTLKADDPEVIAWLEGIGQALTFALAGIEALASDPNTEIGPVRGAVHCLSDELFKGFKLQHKDWIVESYQRSLPAPRLPREAAVPTLDELA